MAGDHRAWVERGDGIERSSLLTSFHLAFHLEGHRYRLLD
jgi:hypothetical protein